MRLVLHRINDGPNKTTGDIVSHRIITCVYVIDVYHVIRTNCHLEEIRLTRTCERRPLLGDVNELSAGVNSESGSQVVPRLCVYGRRLLGHGHRTPVQGS